MGTGKGRAGVRLALGLFLGPAVGMGANDVAHAHAPADTSFPSFSSSPRSGPASTRISAWGTGCDGADGGFVSLARPGAGTAVATSRMQMDGAAWTSALTVPFGAATGDYVVRAVCTWQRGTPNDYRENPFTVTAAGVSAGSRRLSATPASVPLGGSATVRGTGCPAPGSAIAAVTQDGGELEGAQVGTPNSEGEWAVRFVFKAGYVRPDSAIAVTARCYDGADQVRFTYEPLRLDVTPAPRAPQAKGAAKGGGNRTVDGGVARDAAPAPTLVSGVDAAPLDEPGEDVDLSAQAAADESGRTSPLPAIGLAVLGGLTLAFAALRHWRS